VRADEVLRQRSETDDRGRSAERDPERAFVGIVRKGERDRGENETVLRHLRDFAQSGAAVRRAHDAERRRQKHNADRYQHPAHRLNRWWMSGAQSFRSGS